MFRRWQQHSIESAHHFSCRPDCNSTADVPSFTLRTALSAIPCVSDLCGVDVQWFQDNSSQDLLNSKELSVLMTFGFLVGSRNFISMIIHCVAKFCTTTAYRWLFRGSLSSLRTFWSAVIMSPKCSALGTTVPARLLQEDLVIFVLRTVHCGYPNPVPLLLAAPLEVHEMTCRCLDFLALGFANQAIHAKYLFVLLLIHHFYFCFRFLRFHAAGLPEALHSHFHFFLVLDFRCLCWH